MNSIHKTLCLVSLALLVCSLLPLGAGLTLSRQPATTAATTTLSAASSSRAPAAPEPFHRIVPVSILVYTQSADMSVGGEFEHTMAAINDTYGTDYYYDKLTNYANLATALPGHDILLIPEQEKTNSTLMKTVGTAWAATLTQFVTDGGIVILMDYYGGTYSEVAPTIHIYNASGLMKVYGPISYYPSLSVNLVNSSDALARGVAASWTSPDGTLTFGPAATDGTVVVASGINPVVTHKILGKGHIVLLGYDLYLRQTNADKLLGNAIRLHRHVVFDASHTPYGTIFTALSSFADDLVAQGFAVSSMGSFSAPYIQACEVLVLTAASVAYTASEANVIHSFVLAGGGLFVATDWGSFGDELDSVTSSFGFARNTTDYLVDSDDSLVYPSYIAFDNLGGNQNIVNHSITLGVTRLELDRPGGLVTLPAGAVRLVSTDTDGTCTWYAGGLAKGVAVAAAVVTVGHGRVSVVADWNFMNDGTDPDSDGVMTYFDSDNDVFLINNIRWLSAAGLKERIVLFDESHSPAYTISSGWLPLGTYLTCNGYTVHWMSTFQTSLLATANVLVICEGGSAYTAGQITAITNFVHAGGGLVLVGDWGPFNLYTNPIGNQFGLNMANSSNSYLTDSDDGLIDGPPGSYIVYTDGNIATHPVTQGVKRLEVDRGGGFNRIGAGVALVISDGDGTCHWYNGTLANNVPVFAATNASLGHVVYLSDVEFFSTSDPDTDGQITFFDSDNNLFSVNLFQWLVVNRAPAVTVASPNGGETVSGSITISWTAADADGDSLSYDVYYSANSGATWTAIVMGITTTSTAWDTATAPDGATYLVRVVAHDYELTGQDQSNAIFAVSNHPIPWSLILLAIIVIIVVVVIVVVVLLLRRRRRIPAK